MLSDLRYTDKYFEFYEVPCLRGWRRYDFVCDYTVPRSTVSGTILAVGQMVALRRLRPGPVALCRDVGGGGGKILLLLHPFAPPRVLRPTGTPGNLTLLLRMNLLFDGNLVCPRVFRYGRLEGSTVSAL